MGGGGLGCVGRGLGVCGERARGGLGMCGEVFVLFVTHHQLQSMST